MGPSMVSWVFDSFTDWLEGLLRGACQQVMDQLIGVFDSTTAVSFTSGWWVEPQSRAVIEAVLGLAAALMVGCVLLALVQGLLAGEPTMALRAVLLEAPASVLGVVLLTGVTSVLLKLVDAASAMVLGDALTDASAQFLALVISPVDEPGLLGWLLVSLLTLGGLLVWVEMVVREVLIYLLVAFAPLLLAARVWPAARSVWQDAVKIGVALIFSKFAIALALSLGAAALSGGEPGGSGLPGRLAGAALMLVAAYTPFALLRLLPGIEGMVAAQGIGRSPARGVMTGLQTGYYGLGLARLATGGQPPAFAAGPASPSSAGGDGGSPPQPPGIGPGGAAGGAGGAVGPGGGSGGSGPLPPGRPPAALSPGPRGVGPGPRALGPGSGPAAGGPSGPDPGPAGSGGPAAPGGGPGAGSAGPAGAPTQDGPAGVGPLPAGGVGGVMPPASPAQTPAAAAMTPLPPVAVAGRPPLPARSAGAGGPVGPGRWVAPLGVPSRGGPLALPSMPRPSRL